jgi:histidine ammonia-lyase
MPQKMIFKYGIDKLTIPKIIDISKGKIEGILTSQAIKLVKESREKVEKNSKWF